MQINNCKLMFKKNFDVQKQFILLHMNTRSNHRRGTFVFLFSIRKSFKSIAFRCKYPGYDVYHALISLPALWTEVQRAESFVDKYVTDLHMKFGYIHVKRGEECLEKLKPAVLQLKRFVTSFRKAMDEVFPSQVAVEWLETYFMKNYRAVVKRYHFIQRAVQEQKAWSPRPIPDADKLDENES